jgi:predicted nucleic acid-binding protein
MLLIDSNIWAYYFKSDAPEHKRVVPFVEKMISTRQVAINTVIMLEVAHFLIKKLGPVEGMEKLRLFLRFPFVIAPLDFALALRSAELLAKYSHLGIGGRDAAILATAENLKLSEIATHDTAFKRINWLTVSDPVVA